MKKIEVNGLTAYVGETQEQVCKVIGRIDLTTPEAPREIYTTSTALERCNARIAERKAHREMKELLATPPANMPIADQIARAKEIEKLRKAQAGITTPRPMSPQAQARAEAVRVLAARRKAQNASQGKNGEKKK